MAKEKEDREFEIKFVVARLECEDSDAEWRQLKAAKKKTTSNSRKLRLSSRHLMSSQDPIIFDRWNRMKPAATRRK